MEAMWPQYSTAVAGWRGRRSFWGGAAMTDQAHVVASTGADRGAEAPPRPVIQVVPVKGLPIVAAIVVFLIVAITKNWRWALDWYLSLIHISEPTRLGMISYAVFCLKKKKKKKKKK